MTTHQDMLYHLGGVPVHGEMTTGNVFFVDSGKTTTGADMPPPVAGKTPDTPFLTLDYAIGQCTANNGDIIYVMPGHSETKSATGSLWAADVAGISIIGLGEGSDRPTFTLSHTGAAMTISAANILLRNLLFVAGIDSVTAPMTISAADVSLQGIEWRDTTDIEFIRCFITTAAADRLTVEGCYHNGYTGGNASANFARLVGVDTAVFRNCRFFGKATTAIIEFHTTACSNIDIEDCGFLVTATTDLSKNVVDTATGSTWEVRNCFDLGAGCRFSGGSGAALAKDDVSAVTSLIGTIVDTTTDSLHGKIGTDTEMSDSSLYDLLGAGLKTDSLHSILMGTSGIATFPDPAAAANTVSMAEVLRYISEKQVRRIAVKATGDMSSGYATGDSPVSLFTVTGDVLVRMYASVDVAVTSTSNTGTLEAGVAGNTAALLVQDIADTTAFAIGDSWTLEVGADANGALVADEWLFVGNGADIILTIGTNSMTAGDIDFYCEYIPVSSDGAVAAA